MLPLSDKFRAFRHVGIDEGPKRPINQIELHHCKVSEPFADISDIWKAILILANEAEYDKGNVFAFDFAEPQRNNNNSCWRCLQLILLVSCF